MTRMSQQAESPARPLPDKLGIGEGDTVALVGAPGWLEELIGSLPEAVSVQAGLDGDELFDVIVAFVTERAELEELLQRLTERMAPACRLWIAWPKRASDVATDVTGDMIRQVAQPTGLVDTKVCAIDATWTGLQLVIRRELRAGQRGPAG
jgi:hypothetical protein